jgi:carbon monoxide dehydrogenase subunit G
VQRRPFRDILRAMRARAEVTIVAVALACSALLGAGALAQVEPASTRGFTSEERDRLHEGELVARPVTRRRGSLRLIGGSAWQVVDRPVAETWRVLCDPRSYRNMLPAAEEARVVANGPGQRVVRVSHSVGFVRASYHLRMRFDHERRDIAFRLDDRRPNDLRAAWGFIAVSPYEGEEDRTLVSYGVMADIGGGVLGGILRGEIHEWMLRVPSTIRAYLHGPARDRYVER